MEQQAVMAMLSDIRSKNYIAAFQQIAQTHGVTASELHELCYETKKNSIAFRASWILEYIYIHEPERFMPIFTDFIAQLPTQTNASCQRHFTKILMYLSAGEKNDAYRLAWQETDRERITETIFGWLIDPKTPVAVQANCLDILYQMSKEFDWVKEELQAQIHFLLQNGTAAIQSRGQKILQKIR